MAPQETSDGVTSKCVPDDDDYNNKQYLFIVRHGDRWDYSNPEWKELESSRTGDSPLSALGHQQAQEVGVYLDEWMDERGMGAEDLTAWMSSPFLRCVQTSDDALNSFQRINVDKVPILPEYSIFEWDDGHDGAWHNDLPSLEERKHYFPRLDLNYECLFVPEIPEPRSEFYNRCDDVVKSFHERHQYQPGKVLVMVSHAAGCIALSKAFTQLEATDITPAGPCSIFGFSRTSNTEVWTIDKHTDREGHNGFTGHLSEIGTTTLPWNNFGGGDRKVYTGPPNSRFAPTSDKEEITAVAEVPISEDDNNDMT
eukprot:scaffold26784_cov113-Cylindrotheca_fusiformis.AAC.3